MSILRRKTGDKSSPQGAFLSTVSESRLNPKQYGSDSALGRAKNPELWEASGAVEAGCAVRFGRDTCVPDVRAQQPRSPRDSLQAPGPACSTRRGARALRRHRSTGGSTRSAPRASCSAIAAAMTAWAAASSSSVGLPRTMRTIGAATASSAESAEAGAAGSPADPGVGSVTAECSRASWAAGSPACP